MPAHTRRFCSPTGQHDDERDGERGRDTRRSSLIRPMIRTSRAGLFSPLFQANRRTEPRERAKKLLYLIPDSDRVRAGRSSSRSKTLASRVQDKGKDLKKEEERKDRDWYQAADRRGGGGQGNDDDDTRRRLSAAAHEDSLHPLSNLAVAVSCLQSHMTTVCESLHPRSHSSRYQRHQRLLSLPHKAGMVLLLMLIQS